MMPRLMFTLSVIAALGGPAPAAVPHKAVPPKTLGACAFTTVSEVSQRLEDESHKPIANASRVGDRVMTCLAKLPHHCPPGDQRGKWYTTTNLRTDEAWVLPDAKHMCGGA
jgi:hypothetical protein